MFCYDMIRYGLGLKWNWGVIGKYFALGLYDCVNIESHGSITGGAEKKQKRGRGKGGKGGKIGEGG